MKTENKSLLFIFLLFIPAFASCQLSPERQWPGFRGYLASGVLDDANLPSDFSFEKNINIKWKARLPGMGISSPAIWGDRLFITSAVSENDNAGFKPGLYGDVRPVNDSSVHEWKVYCFDKNTGKMLWERTAYKGVPKIKRHPKSTHANTTMAVDGNHAVAFFGSEGLYCYDHNGNLLWQKSFGVLKSIWNVMKTAEWEFASSPVIYEDRLIIQSDVLENSFLAVFDVKTGNQLWKKERDEIPGWCTPNIYTHNGKTSVVVNGYRHRGAYDFSTGEEIWKMSGGGDIQIPTPIIGDDLIYFNSAHGKSSPILAVKKSATGDITLADGEDSNEWVAWSHPRMGSYMHTMLLYRNRLYNVNWNGTINCLDPLTGSTIYNAKIGKAESFIASPVASDGRIYIVSEEGVVYIIDSGDEFSILAEIPMNEICMTAPSITENIIYFRSQNYLYAAGKK
jgi:outer membrane protein assembly factor BamB